MNTDTKAKGSENVPASAGRRGHSLLLTLVVLFIILSALFWKSYSTEWAHFSNDGPLGAMVAEQNRPPAILTGLWVNLNWLGSEGITPPPGVTTLIRALTTPFMYSRILPPLSLMFVGLCAFFCFRSLGLSPTACSLGALASGLNSDFLSTTCWGVSSQIFGFGANFLAVGLISDTRKKWRWIRAMLAGMAVGIGLMEAYDIGALFSLMVAAYVVYKTLFSEEGTVPERLGRGISKTAIVAIFAGFIACAALTTLIGTQLKGMAQAETHQSKEENDAIWSYDTAWSFPKKEMLSVMVPGLFGYRQVWHMYENQQPNEDQYWGAIGESPGLPRLSGTGYYAGVLVLMVGLWGIASSFRKENSPFTPVQRRLIWFWAGLLVVSALLAFGKHGFLYRVFFSLPYASAIRNPTKFMHIFSWATVIVFAYGLHGIDISYLRKPFKRLAGTPGNSGWWSRASLFEKNWIFGSVAAVVLSLIGWMVYASSENKLKDYLNEEVSESTKVPRIDPAMVNAVAKFSIHSAGCFVFLLVVSVVLLIVIFSGRLSGPRARLGTFLLGLFLIGDLASAGAPWIVYWNVPYKYATDPVMKFLADKPYEHRVAAFPPNAVPQQLLQQIAQPFTMMFNAYGSHWKQQIFPYYNIQCADIIQEPRVAEDKQIFSRAVPNPIRFWQLSNTRYLLGPGHNFAEHMDPAGTTFRTVQTFNLVPKTANPSGWPVDYSAQPDPNGDLAVIEFVPALKRATLFSNWSTPTNDAECLALLSNENFDLHQTVLLSPDAHVPAPAASSTNQSAGTVEINPNYRSKRVELDADVKVPSVLLLSERYDPKWQAWVDGKPAPVLRCDYILRGIYLTPGKHNVVFKFVTSLTTLYISLAAVILGLGMIAFLMFTGDGGVMEVESPKLSAADKLSPEPIDPKP